MSGWMVLAGIIGAWIGMWLRRRRRRKRENEEVSMGWFRKTAKDYLGEGTRHSMRGEYGRAIKALSKALEVDPQNAVAYMHRGIAFLNSGQAEKALQDFGASLRLEQNALCYYNRALAWMAKGDIENALRDLGEAIRLSPQDAESYNLRAILYSTQGEQERALEEIERAIELGHPEGRKSKAIILEKAGRDEEALNCWSKLLDTQPNDALALCRRGLLLMRHGRKQEARHDLERAWQRRKDLNEHWRAEIEKGLKQLGE